MDCRKEEGWQFPFASGLEAALGLARCVAAALRGAGFGQGVVLGGGPLDDEQFSDVLYRCCAEFIADGFQIGVAFFAVVVEDADLDQFVAVEAAGNFAQYGFGQAVLTDHNDRVERIGAGTQGAAFF